MKHLLLLCGVLFLASPFVSRAADTPPGASATGSGSAPASSPKEKAKGAAPAAAIAPSPQVSVVTSLGSFTLELNAERAPLTVANFLKYVDQGHYTNTIFHRVIPNFVIQGGGFEADGKPKPAPTKVVNESGNGLTNQRGTVGMARGQEPHGSDAQFYVNLYDNEALDPNKTRWGYAVFGKVVQGMDVVDKIGNVATGSRGAFKEDAPLQPVVIQKIERVPSP
jgi:peptidyl-prolyl cis-trans isomerase A (cyclophilin A)/peptidyl-prolyl cis-trans isomerase B (cyclophilin B)